MLHTYGQLDINEQQTTNNQQVNNNLDVDLYPPQ